MQSALRTAQLTAKPLERLEDVMTGVDDALSRAQFTRVLAALCDDVNFRVYDLLTNLFNAFPGDDDTVATAQLFVGSLVFTAGSKSEKLSAAFRMLDTDEDGFLSQRQLEEFLACFLRALCSCSSALREAAPADVQEVVAGCVGVSWAPACDWRACD